MDRKLTTIFASDVVGFSKMMGMDEVNTLKILKERREAIDGIIDEHAGIIFGSAGDSVIAEFSSPIKAAEAAVATQLKMKTMNMDQAELAGGLEWQWALENKQLGIPLSFEHQGILETVATELAVDVPFNRYQHTRF